MASRENTEIYKREVTYLSGAALISNSLVAGGRCIKHWIINPYLFLKIGKVQGWVMSDFL